MRPTPSEIFEKRTSILPRVIARTCIDQREHHLSADAVQWFVDHTDAWVRWFHANNAKWRRLLESDRGRDQLYVWVNHWLDAFQSDIERYRQKHPVAALV
jgi:hypothetical protein